MESFRRRAVVVSTILGFGITRLLTSLVFMFRARGRNRLDWLPLVCAATIFVQTLLFWWTLGRLGAQVPQWTFAKFLFLVIQVMALFLASTLIMPTSEAEEGASLRACFDGDGR